MTADQTLSGVILAGGASRRMGVDKAVLQTRGRRLVDRAAMTLGEIVDDVVCARGNRSPLDLDGIIEVPDAVADAGPLGGLVAGLEAVRPDLVAVLAVDLPTPNAAVLRRLAEHHDGSDAVVPVVYGRWQPLHAIWARSAAPALRRRLDSDDRSLAGALRTLDIVEIGPEGWGDLDDGSFARDVDVPADLAMGVVTPPPEPPTSR